MPDPSESAPRMTDRQLIEHLMRGFVILAQRVEVLEAALTLVSEAQDATVDLVRDLASELPEKSKLAPGTPVMWMGER